MNGNGEAQAPPGGGRGPVGPRAGLVVRAALLALALVGAAASPARADLRWRGQNLTEQGIHKGFGLPTFFLYMDGVHSSFAAQGLSAETPAGKVFWGFYNHLAHMDSLRDDDGDEVDVHYRTTTYTLVQRLILFTPLRTQHVQLYVEAIPVIVASDFHVGPVSGTTAGLGDFGVGGGFTLADYRVGDWLEIEGILALDIFLPTGHYRPGGRRNLSFNVHSYLFQQDVILHFPKVGNGLYVSPAFYFTGATENDRFRNPVDGTNTSYRFGPSYQQIFKVLYRLDPKGRATAGAAGFFDFQYADDRMGGSRIENSKERSLMAGPLVTAILGSRAFADLSVLREFGQRNRPQGTRVTFIFYWVF